MAGDRVTGGMFTRDPVSELFDRGARRLLARAYARPWQWVSTRLADPTPAHIAYFGGLGINVLGRDNAPTVSGGHKNMRSRWGRGFCRAVYYQHTWYYARGALQDRRRASPNRVGAVELEIGQRIAALGVIPAGRVVRVRVHRGGQAADRAVARLPDSARIYSGPHEPGARQADAERRDW